MTEKLCSFEGCNRPLHAKTLCLPHYKQQRKGGPLRPVRSASPIDRFWANVDKRGPGDCWEWTAVKVTGGYGKIVVDGKNQRAHRYSYKVAKGPIPSGMVVDHTCHNTGCVNPAHLRLATRSQNMENRRGPDSGSTSKFRGVSWNSERKQWVAQVKHHGTTHFLGRFDKEEEAAEAARAKRNELFTHNIADRNAA